MKTLLEYQQDITQADRARRLVASTDYKTLEAILKRLYDAAVENLLYAENETARSRIKCIKDIQDEIQADIQRGDVATDAIKTGQVSDSPKDE